MNTKLMNKHELIAYNNIKGAFNWYVGGWYNCLMDGYHEDIPTLEEAKSTVYIEAMNNRYKSGYEICGRAPKEMRFAGEDFCKEVVEELFLNDSDVAEIWGEEANTEETKEDTEMKKEWTREDARKYIIKNYTVKEMREHLKAEGVKGISRAKKEELIEMMLDVEEQKDAEKGKTVSTTIKVNMLAFTGMVIGEFEAELQDDKILVYTERSGELMFDAKTGKQICDDEAKARYANRVERV